MEVGEIAATPAGHQYLLADLVRPLKDQNPAPASGCGNGAHQASGASTNNDQVRVFHQQLFVSGSVAITGADYHAIVL